MVKLSYELKAVIKELGLGSWTAMHRSEWDKNGVRHATGDAE